MAIYIENLKIGHFRGIHDLTIENLNHINIIAGDNNSGKTSVLEAFLLLCSPNDFNNILRLARMGDTNVFLVELPFMKALLTYFLKILQKCK